MVLPCLSAPCVLVAHQRESLCVKGQVVRDIPAVSFASGLIGENFSLLVDRSPLFLFGTE